LTAIDKHCTSSSTDETDIQTLQQRLAEHALADKAKQLKKQKGPYEGIESQFLVPRTGHGSRFYNGFARVWGIFFLPHAKFHFGVSRAQQGQSVKAGQIGLVCQSSGLFIGVRFLSTERSQTW
jgi:hypothetical protein